MKFNEVFQEQLDRVGKEFGLIWYQDGSCDVVNKGIPADQFQIGGKYDINLYDYIVNEPPNSTLSSNWNHEVKIKSHKLQIIVKDIKGKMILTDAKDDLGNTYKDLWIPKFGIIE